jgi:histone acetyltransferase
VLIVKSIGSSEVLGGICFRPFHYQGFAEIVFLAITEHEKSKGFGARVMNHCKEHVKTENIKFFLTYADNTAIGYFVKQGFAKKKQMVRQRWDGYIKDYVRSTLMECKILYNVNYIFIKDTLLKQKEAVVKKIRNANLASQKVHDGLDFSSGPIEISKIPGLSETSWNLRMNPSGGAQFPKIYAILQQLKKMKASEPFLYPVDAESAPNYYEIVKNPMDISTIEAKIQSNAYESKEEVISDFTLIIENCRTYNDASTIYVRYANILESKFRSFIAQQFPLG